MKSLFLKIATPLLLVLFVFGIVQYVDAAFPGKQKQNTEITVPDNNAVTGSVEKAETATPVDDEILLLVILCFILPPLAVYLKYDDAGTPFIVNVILTLLCGLPGVIHALIHVLRD